VWGIRLRRIPNSTSDGLQPFVLDVVARSELLAEGSSLTTQSGEPRACKQAAIGRWPR